MKPQFAKLYDHTDGYVRMAESPKTWFARAKTAKKETPEALAGIHADHVMGLIDEASGVPEEVFNTAEGMLTNINVLFIMISNPTRLIGTFYDSHHKDKANWQTATFSCLDSPIVDREYEERIRLKHGADSDEYRIRVIGQFPKADMVDSKGYVPLITADMIRIVPDSQNFDELSRLGIDPAGEGSDLSVGVMRNKFAAKIVFKEKVSTSLSIAAKTLTVSNLLKIKGHNTWIDNFGEGANVAVELARARFFANPVNVGDKAEEHDRFLNKRAEAYWRMREWLAKGGVLIGEGWDELLNIRFKTVEISGKLKIMGKEEMRKEGIKSPNIADALMLTFYENELLGTGSVSNVSETEKFDPHSPM